MPRVKWVRPVNWFAWWLKSMSLRLDVHHYMSTNITYEVDASNH